MSIRDRWNEFRNLTFQQKLAIYGIKFTKYEHIGPMNRNDVAEIMKEKGCDLCYFQFTELTDGYDSDYTEGNTTGMIQITKTGNIFETIGNWKETIIEQQKFPKYKHECRDPTGLKLYSDIEAVPQIRKIQMENEADWVLIKGCHKYPLELTKIIVLTTTENNESDESNELREKYKQLLFDTSENGLLTMNNFVMIRPII